jgi:hypothetical protein
MGAEDNFILSIERWRRKTGETATCAVAAYRVSMIAMKTFRRITLSFLLLVSLWIISACGALSGVDTAATLQAEVTEFALESTGIAETHSAQATGAFQSAERARTEVVYVDGINQQLAVTMRAALPATQQMISDQAIVTPGMNAPLPGQFTPTPNLDGGQIASNGGSNQLTEIGVALAVRESDDCADVLQTQISASSARIYATTRILNALNGTQVSAAWNYAGESVYSNTPFVVPRDDDDFCLWFYIEPTDVAFTPGDWSVQFVVDGVAQPLAPFTMVS